MCKSGDGLSKGSKCFFGVGVGFSSFGIGFLASDGQKRSWNWEALARLGRGGVVQVLAGIPLEVRIMESSVGEKMRLLDVSAEANLASTKLGSDSVRPSNIFLYV